MRHLIRGRKHSITGTSLVASRQESTRKDEKQGLCTTGLAKQAILRGLGWRETTRPQGIQEALESAHITPQMTIETLETLDATKAAGPDELKNRVGRGSGRPLKHKPE